MHLPSGLHVVLDTICVCAAHLTSLRVCDSSLRSPWPGLHVPSLLQGKHEASIADHHLPSIQTLKDTLWEQRDPGTHISQALRRMSYKLTGILRVT